MKKVFAITLPFVCALFLCACNKDDTGTIQLSSKTLEFEWSASSKSVYSGGGFYLDAVRQDGKVISDRLDDTDGMLLLDADWIIVKTPDARNQELAKGMIVKVKDNKTGKERKCEIVVHNGSETRTVSVTQKIPEQSED